MQNRASKFTVSAEWLEARIGQPELRIVDASWYLPAQNRDGAGEYAAGHIPGAVFFDQDEIAEHSTGLPHSIPTAEDFASAVGRLGISGDHTIVVYDGPGIFTAPRVWWLFRLFGAKNVYVLNGGFDGWKRQGRPVETAAPTHQPAEFRAAYRDEWVTSFDAMMLSVAEGGVQIADARGAGRFSGSEPEPREGMRSGHMPGARNLPFAELSQDGHLKSLDELKATIEASGLDLAKPIVTTCGSGVTAAVITLALHSLGHEENTLYDGSWSEWGGHADTPIVTGDAAI